MAKYSICIAEDEYYVQRSLEARIAALSLDIEIMGVASNGQEALSLYHQYSPDLFLVDINMPDVNGIEFIKLAKTSAGRTKVIIISGYSDFSYMRTAIQLSVFDYIQKPIDGDEFATVIKRAIQRIDDDRLQMASPRLEADGMSEKELSVRIRAYLEEYYSENLTLERIANAFHISTSYLSHHFKDKEGVSIVKYLEAIRVNKSKLYLRDSLLSISDIGLKVGYTDNVYFSKVFRKITGLSPGDYRKRSQKTGDIL